MDIMKIGTQLLAAKLGNNANSDQITNVLGSLLGGDSNSSGIDLGGILGNLQSSGLGDVAKSWLGDGANDEISENQLEGLFGSEKIQEMASQLGTDQNDLLSGLKEALPQMIDQSSSGGNLLDSVGGISGLASIASKFLK
jgi:uncharacterized protein YidB (DUF937 family)